MGAFLFYLRVFLSWHPTCCGVPQWQRPSRSLRSAESGHCRPLRPSADPPVGQPQGCLIARVSSLGRCGGLTSVLCLFWSSALPAWLGASLCGPGRLLGSAPFAADDLWVHDPGAVGVETLGPTPTNPSSHQELRASARCICANELVQFLLYKPSTRLQHLETRFQSYSTGFR